MNKIISNAILHSLSKAKNVFTRHFPSWKEGLWSNRTISLSDVTENLKNGMEFGLFGQKGDCYFEDGTKATYETLWKALGIIHNLVPGHGKTLYHICPHKFIGTTDRRFSKRRWRKMVALLAPCEYMTLW